MLDPRDSRLNVGFVLADDTIPDNVNWSYKLRDKSGVWLDYVDASFSKCQVQRVIPDGVPETEVEPQEDVVYTTTTAVTPIVIYKTIGEKRDAL